MPVSTIEAVKQIKAYIAAKGFSYPEGFIENFFLCLKTKPFVILAGISGTGKTRLVRLFSESIGAECRLLPVRPDWSDSSALFGHSDINGCFHPGPVLQFLREAREHPQKPFILCLDEMNLARVEYYLSDLLSVMETRELVDGTIISAQLFGENDYGADETQRSRFGSFDFPQNLYIVGTVNMDETTFSFSKKVLDRANTIEFNTVDLIPHLDPTRNASEQLMLPNSFLRSDYIHLSHCSEDSEFVLRICAELQRLNAILQKANEAIGYRVRDEIVFYLLYNKTEGNLLPPDHAFDMAVMQKILPRIQGSSFAIRNMLLELFRFFAGDPARYDGESNAEKMQNLLSDVSAQVRYRRCAEKTALMLRRFEEDGYASFWL